MRFIRLNPLAVIIAAFAFFIPAFAHAQRGARLSAPAHPMATSRRFATAPSSGSARIGRRASGLTNNGYLSNSLGLGQISFFPNLNYGIGINGINYIATQDIGTEAAIDPATQWRLAIAERVARSTGGFAGGGYYLLDGGGAYAYPYSAEPSEAESPSPQQQQQQQPQVIVVQQAPAQATQSSAAETSPEPPLPDAGQFTLVLHNGSQIEAVAFTQMKDRIVYITRDGSRRSLALSDLDADATVRLNQERGTPLQLSL
jgi:hypothetical protein